MSVHHALLLAWKAAHFVCAKRLEPFLPALVEGLERRQHLRLTDQERRQVQTMSVATAERFLRTQSKPRLSGFSFTTPGVLRKSQIPVRTFAEWEDERPGFVEMDLVAHCGTHADGGFLYTLTLTDVATGWTECLPLLHKSADTVVAALEQARRLFPFPLLGIDTDDGCEFINERLLSYCTWEHLTFTCGRPGVKNDQNHVEQKNGSVVREAVGYVRLEGVQAYHQLREVYRALRLVVNCFQPSFKLQARISHGNRVRRVYDAARIPRDRLLTSGVLPDAWQQELSTRIQQLDSLRLSEHLDALRYALLCHAHLPAGMAASRPRLDFTLSLCTCEPLSELEKPSEALEGQGSLPTPQEILSWPRTTRDPLAEVWEEILEVVLEHPEWNSTQILQELGRRDPDRVLSVCPATVIQGVARIRQQIRGCLEEDWPPELIQAEAINWTGKTLSVNTIAAYARSVRAFCNWLVRQEYLPETPFPKDVMPKAARCLPQPIDQDAFECLLQACQLPDGHAGQDQRMTARNQAILWLLLDAGLSASEVCRLCLEDVDTLKGTVTVRGKKGRTRTLPLSEQGKRAVSAYVAQARLTPAWPPVVRDAQNRLFLTERRHPLTKNGLTLLFIRLNQRAGLATNSMSPSSLRDAYAIRFLQAGGEGSLLQDRLGVTDPASVRRYQRFCDEHQRAEAGTQVVPEGQAKPPPLAKQSKNARRKKRGRG